MPNPPHTTIEDLELIWTEYRQFVSHPNSITMCTLISKIVRYHQQWIFAMEGASIPEHVLPEGDFMDYAPDKYTEDVLNIKFTSISTLMNDLQNRVEIIESKVFDRINF